LLRLPESTVPVAAWRANTARTVFRCTPSEEACNALVGPIGLVVVHNGPALLGREARAVRDLGRRGGALSVSKRSGGGRSSLSNAGRCLEESVHVGVVRIG